MSELQQAISEMRNMQQAYDELATAMGAVADQQGKAQLAAAISAKGVPASTEDNLSALATKVGNIPQQVNTRTSDFEQMIAPYPYIWNVYTVATELMQNELPSYIPSYMAEYKSRYGANSFFVGEYYLGYTTLELTGADGYLTCDGDFYAIADGVVTHTSPDGTIETYEAESIIHTWHDVANSMANRWVAFFYLADAYSFTNTTSSICPRRVALCGTCNSFIVAGESRLTDVWVIGTLGTLYGGSKSNNWNPAQVISNLQTSTQSIFTDSNNINSLIMPDTEVLSGNPLIQTTATSRALLSSIPQCISMPKLRTGFNSLYSKKLWYNHKLVSLSLPSLEDSNIIIADIQSTGWSSRNAKPFSELKSIDLRSVIVCTSGGLLYYNGTSLQDMVYDNGDGAFNKLTDLRLDNLERLSCLVGSNYHGTTGYISIEHLSFPSLLYCNILFDGLTNLFNSAGKLQRISMPLCTQFNYLCKKALQINSVCNFVSLYDIEVGALEYSFNAASWNPTNVLSTPEGIAQINVNIRNHIAANVADGNNTLTFTVSTNLLNNLEQATLNAFAAKHWLVAGV